MSFFILYANSQVFNEYAANLPGPSVACPKCKQYFCLDCDIYIHESLHNCPGCESFKQIQIG